LAFSAEATTLLRLGATEFNADSAYCTSDCKLNVCGDGKHFVGWELCDEGEANNDVYGSSCTTACEPGRRCGDGLLDVEFGEQCDLGQGNGAGRGDDQGISCDTLCRRVARRAFVTGQAFTGDLGGVPGADDKCQAAATAAELGDPHEFMAYISTGELSADERYGALLGEPMPVVTTTGVKIAGSYAELLALGPLGEGIAADEHGQALYYAWVATNTDPDGSVHSPDLHCQGWSSAKVGDELRLGYNAFPADSPDWPIWKDMGWWLSAEALSCAGNEFHLYCFEV
jgi:hypothetical protein